jgi:predicted amidophosphoribosyltransferase
MSDDFHIICAKCEARSPANFRICGKCGSRLQKRADRSQDWGSNLKETTAVQDNREVLMQKLRKLGELKDKGMLSDAEFTAAKSKLLR